MPQADILAFRATLLLLPAIFLVGYYFFATVWVPRLICTFRARAWLTQVQLFPLVLTTEQWPEIFLMFVQFAGLVWVISQVNLTGAFLRLPPQLAPTLVAVHYHTVGGLPVENFFQLWNAHRAGLFFAPAGAAVAAAAATALSGLPFHPAGKQFPLLLGRLRRRLPAVVSELPGGARD